MDLAIEKIQVKIRQIFNQIKSIWLSASASYSPFTLWFGVIIPSLFINLLMLALPLAMLQAYDRVIPNNSTQTLIILVVIVILAAVAEMILRIMRSIICNWSFAREDYLQISRVSENILKARIGMREETERETFLTYSDLINRSKQSHSEQIIVNILDLVFVGIFLMLIAYLGGVLVLIPLVLMISLALKMYGSDDRLKLELKKQKEGERKRISSIVDALSGIFTIKALSMEPSILRRAESLELKKAESIYDINLIHMGINTVASLYSQLIFFLIVAIGAVLVMYHSLTVGALAACTILAGRGMQPVAKFIGLWSQRNDSEASKKFLRKLDSLKKEPTNAQGISKIIQGKITFDHVYIKGQKSKDYIFDDISLTIEPRETVCIHDDGTYAWAIFYIMMKYLTPARGKLLIDDINVDEFNLENYRNQICYLSKEGVLYNGTILQNISNFDPKKESIAREISVKIGLEGIISKFPQGYQTKVGPNAVQIFSTGFMQLTSFVRTMVNEPKIALFNNITFNVDKPTIRLLINAINLYKQNTTMVIAATEPGVLALAKRNYFIHDKKLEEVHYEYRV